jgi:hypothetical protein
MFETLETRQFLSATLTTDTAPTSTGTTVQPTSVDADAVQHRSGGDREKYMEFKLKEVMISGYSL